MKKTFLILSVAMLFGCQTVLEDVAVPAAEVKAVVFCSSSNFFLIDSLGPFLDLRLTKSRPVIDNSQNGEFEPIQDAQVTIKGPNLSATLDKRGGGGQYFTYANSQVLAGFEYTLNIKTPENGTLTSTVTMPDSIMEYALDIDSIDQEWQVQYNGRLSIPDNPNKAEYFRVEAFAVYNVNNFDPTEMWVEGEYFSDENAVDGMVNARFTTYSWDSENGSRPKIYLIISAITKAHFEYGKALENYDPENPFSEPSPLPNNIEGGLGLFTLSNSRIIDLK